MIAKHIGVTCSHFELPPAADNQARLMQYTDAINRAGGTGEMLWIPQDEEYALHAHQLAKKLDGLVISGGADLPPSMYGEKTRGDADVVLIRPERPAFESQLVREFVEQGKPILGICYGCQYLNVWHGGSLIQDIPTEWPNPIAHSNTRHSVHLVENSLLHQIMGVTELVIESSHHQAVGRLGKGAEVTATAPDGVAEAIEFVETPFLLGVQWHPERDPEAVTTHRLFEALVAACAA